MSISELLSTTNETPLEAGFGGQIQNVKQKETKGGKPYLEWTVADSTGNITLKIWNNHPQWNIATEVPRETLLHFSGDWTQNQYGIDGKAWKFRKLTEEEKRDFLSGDPEIRAKQNTDWEDISDLLSQLADPRLKAICDDFVDQFEDRFRRTAAARRNHHARRGGLVEHVAQMMRSADAICGVYPYLNRDLMIAGVLFHDCGKLWENTYPESGFNQLHLMHGEMLGHIPLGLELVNKLWRDLPLEKWREIEPASEDVRLHLLHLIASHHGQYDFGSPTLPRTPEAHALHYIDNLDAKLEMVKDAYATANETAPGIFERQFPLPAPLVTPLPPFASDSAPEVKETPQGPRDLLF
ncbi:MAG: HD domain-containing protein [Akkermansiaceae bacterium]|jgi:3'-5' exoribonuclease